MKNTAFDPDAARPTTQAGVFSDAEVQLANRNHGALLELLACDITPAGGHYLLNHFDVPVIAANDHVLTFDGHFETPMTLSMDDIRSMPATTQPIVMECAGNGRTGMMPRPYSMPWGDGAVGNAEWTGTPLMPILRQAGIADTVQDIVFKGADYGFDKGQPHHFGRSLRPDQLEQLDVMLVYAMNGQPLLPQHGAPLRVMVPGWYGMASVKWLTQISAWDRPFDGFQQVQTYRFRQSRDDVGQPVEDIAVKSLMVSPGVPDWITRDRWVEPGVVTIQGRAWSGNGRKIVKVELGVGDSWIMADLKDRSGPYGWTGWRCNWTATSGEHLLRCRATDDAGQVQPLDSSWNIGGFANNAAQQVRVVVP